MAPVGAYAYQQIMRQGQISLEIDAMGTCVEIDASVLMNREKE
jgi:hypothetical protein